MLGKLVKDKITGFQGIVTSVHTYLSECTKYGVQQPIDKDGKLPQVEFFVEARLLEVVGTPTQE